MSYLSKLGPEATMRLLGELSQACADNGGPLSREINELVQARKFKELLDFQLPYAYDSDVNDLINARQILGFYSKNRDLQIEGVDKEAVALEKFIESERICKETNRRLRTSQSNGRIAQVEHYAMRKISKVLGDLPLLADLKFQYGPGANTSVKASRVNPRVKLSSRIECNHKLIPSVAVFLSEAPQLANLHGFLSIWEEYDDVCLNVGWHVDVTATPGVLMFVPKNALTYRSIIKEPGFSGMLQKGYGTYLKLRMRQHGLDLSDQEVNRKMAKQASIDNRKATVDKKMASDLNAREVVYRLFPLDWACRLDSLCSSVVTYKDRTFELEKFSSMGNAFTFEVESLIFWALAIGCCRALNLHVDEKTVGCFGDDIIIPVEAYDLYVETLSYYGFLVNTEKSFKDGPFRESCGADYYLGIDIRPYYVRKNLTYEALFTMHNFFVRHFEFELAAIVREHIPDHVALYGPDGYGDGHLIGSYSLKTRRADRRSGYCGGYFETYTLKPRRLQKGTVLPGDRVFPAYSVYTRSGEQSPTDPDVIRGSKGYAKMSIYTLTTGIFR